MNVEERLSERNEVYSKKGMCYERWRCELKVDVVGFQRNMQKRELFLFILLKENIIMFHLS